MKRVLMIAYIYPPQASAGVHRTVKFARYLPRSRRKHCDARCTGREPRSRESSYDH